MDNIIYPITDELLSMTKVPCLAGDVRGMTSPKVRWLLNHVAGRLPSNEAYLEIGCYAGATLISALLDHQGVTAYACDNFCKFATESAQRALRINLKNYEARLPKVTFFNKDCFELAKERAPFAKPIGVLFYDGSHSEGDQFKVIVRFNRFFSAKCIVVIDDWLWPSVRKGAWKALGAIRPKKLEFRELLALKNCDLVNFWNRLGMFYIER